jgi:hypothetical protein
MATARVALELDQVGLDDAVAVDEVAGVSDPQRGARPPVLHRLGQEAAAVDARAVGAEPEIEGGEGGGIGIPVAATKPGRPPRASCRPPPAPARSRSRSRWPEGVLEEDVVLHGDADHRVVRVVVDPARQQQPVLARVPVVEQQ